MENVKKKKPGKSPRWLPFAAVLAAAGLCLGALWLVNHVKKSQYALPEATEKVRTLLSFDESALVSITITPPDQRAYTLLYQDGTLHVQGEESYPVRDSIAKLLLNCATIFEVQDTIMDTAKEEIALSDCGLSPAKATAAFTYQDGTVVTQSVGERLPLDTVSYYAMFAGDTNLYAVSPDVYEAYSNSLSSLHAVSNPSVQTELIDRVTIQGEQTYSLRYFEGGWLLDAPFSYPLSTEKVEALLTSIKNMRFSTWVGEADKLNLADYGLDAPRLKLTLDIAASTLTIPDETGAEHTFDVPESKVEVALGHSLSDVLMYALYDGEVMTASYLTFDFLVGFTPEDYYQQNPLSFSANNLSSVVVEDASGRAEYAVRLIERLKQNGEFELDESGNILYDVVAEKDGKTLDSTAFLRWYGLLTQVTAIDNLPEGYVCAGDALTTVTITNAAGTLTRTVAFYAYTPVYQAMAVDGTALYAVRTSWRDEVGSAP